MRESSSPRNSASQVQAEAAEWSTAANDGCRESFVVDFTQVGSQGFAPSGPFFFALQNSGTHFDDDTLREYRRAIEHYEQVLVIDYGIGNRYSERIVLRDMDCAYDALGETRRAIEVYERSLAIAREIGDRRGEGSALWSRSMDLDRFGRRVEAVSVAESALKIYELIEDRNADEVRTKLAEWRNEEGQV
jgi:tetratricopeptide (TPR) repeat protein